MFHRKRIQSAVLTALLTVGASAVTTQTSFAQQVPDKIRIGYAVSLTGPFAGPASMLPVANYRLWAKQVNAKGGLAVKGDQATRDGAAPAPELLDDPDTMVRDVPNRSRRPHGRTHRD
jgi:hypothetical protein